MGRPCATICKAGHPATPENRYVSRGCSTCKICARTRAKNLTPVQRAQKNQTSGEWQKRHRADRNRQTQGLKQEVLTHYGKNGSLQCGWPECGVVDLDVLTLDHVANDGAVARRVKRETGKTLYRRLRRQKFPKGFQTLCANHQLKKEMMRQRELA